MSLLYKVDDFLLFYNKNINMNDALDIIENGTIFLNVFGDEISKDIAKIELIKQYQRLVSDEDLFNILNNIELSNYIISIVRTELLEIEYNQGCSQILEELSDIIPLLQLGMFDTASTILLQKESDNITEEQLIRWSNLLISSDSIDKES